MWESQEVLKKKKSRSDGEDAVKGTQEPMKERPDGEDSSEEGEASLAYTPSTKQILTRGSWHK